MISEINKFGGNIKNMKFENFSFVFPINLVKEVRKEK